MSSNNKMAGRRRLGRRMGGLNGEAKLLFILKTRNASRNWDDGEYKIGDKQAEFDSNTISICRWNLQIREGGGEAGQFIVVALLHGNPFVLDGGVDFWILPRRVDCCNFQDTLRYWQFVCEARSLTFLVNAIQALRSLILVPLWHNIYRDLKLKINEIGIVTQVWEGSWNVSEHHHITRPRQLNPILLYSIKSILSSTNLLGIK